MAAGESKQSPWLFYYIQNDKGESGSHPNACRLKSADPARITLQEVLESFPLSGTGSFHFRFQVSQDKQLLFLDLTNPGDIVPVVGSNVIAKVLRLDTIRCASRNHSGLELRSYRPGAAKVVRQSSSSQRLESSAASMNHAAVAAATAAMAMPVMRSGVLHDVPKEIDGDPHIRDSGEGGDIYSKFKETDERGMRPVKAVSSDLGVALPVPVSVDADLEGKSDYVKAKVMAARTEAAKAAESAVAEVAARDAAAASDALGREAAKAQHETRLREWATEQGGKAVKPIRALLASLHTVLWEGAKWQPLGMDKLIIPSKVKLHFLKACTVVHPDKAAGLPPAQQYIAGQVFDYINTAFREFQEKEVGQ